MSKIKVTLASVPSLLADKQRNLDKVEEACRIADRDGARLILLPELMLTGHGGHPLMRDNAEPVPDGPLARAVIELSKTYGLCICVGIAELCERIVYNSQMVADRGLYLGLQRKINMSYDEYCYFGAGDRVNVFDIGDLRFGITICYDSHFPEIALMHNLNHADVILGAHAARFGSFPYEPWPKNPPSSFYAEIISGVQKIWTRIHCARASDNNAFVLLCNTVGSSTEGLEGVVANHGGTVMAIDPLGEIFLRTQEKIMVEEIATVELDLEKRQTNHRPTQNRRLEAVIRMLQEKL